MQTTKNIKLPPLRHSRKCRWKGQSYYPFLCSLVHLKLSTTNHHQCWMTHRNKYSVLAVNIYNVRFWIFTLTVATFWRGKNSTIMEMKTTFTCVCTCCVCAHTVSAYQQTFYAVIFQEIEPSSKRKWGDRERDHHPILPNQHNNNYMNTIARTINFTNASNVSIYIPVGHEMKMELYLKREIENQPKNHYPFSCYQIKWYQTNRLYYDVG